MYGAQDPGNWQSFKTRQDIQRLPLMEQKSKFIQEQLNFDNAMAAFSAQAHVGGIQYNPVLSVAFDGSALSTITGFTSTLEVTYSHDVTVTGIPSIIVPNGLQGGGSTSGITYTFDSTASSKVLIFTYVQAANLNGLLGIGAGRLIANTSDLANVAQASVANTLDAATANAALTGVAGVAAAGTGGNTSFEPVVLTLNINAAGAVSVATITSIASATTAYFVPGNTITIAASEIAGATTGTIIYTLIAGALTGDTLNLAGGDRYIALNGGSINSVGGRPARDVFAVSGINDTAVPS